MSFSHPCYVGYFCRRGQIPEMVSRNFELRPVVERALERRVVEDAAEGLGYGRDFDLIDGSFTWNDEGFFRYDRTLYCVPALKIARHLMEVNGCQVADGGLFLSKESLDRMLSYQTRRLAGETIAAILDEPEE